jgi:hypothetical protein
MAGVARVIAIFTLDVNWDEFMLLERAVRTVRSGELAGGGRPGLATLVLVPFAAACRNSVDTIVQARLLWTAMVVGAAVAFWFLLRDLLRPSPYRSTAIATALALWVLAPPFLRTSTQVRTDQPAILFGLGGGLALIASRRTLWGAPAAGLLFGIGFLFSQKLLYVVGLVVVLAVGQLAIEGRWRPGREAARFFLAGAAFFGVVVAYRGVMGRLVGTPTLLPVSGGLSSFDYYREVYGWSLYRGMLPLLVPQVLVMATLVLITLGWAWRRGRHGPELATAWAVTAVGLGVLLFHAGRFPYFYMVLGLFPAAVAGLICAPVLDRLRTSGRRTAFLVVLGVPLFVLALGQAEAVTRNQQRHQRVSLEFVERNFEAAARGFQGHAVFACRQDPDPYPVRFGIAAVYGGEDRQERIDELIAEFRDRPITFMIAPAGERYPPELWEFWLTRYVHYYGAIHVPGRAVEGGAAWSATFEVIIPGEYIWRVAHGDAVPLEVDGHRLDPGTSVVLSERGYYELGLPEGGKGMLVLALPDPPAPGPARFYSGF